jgi:pyridoxamine 5'-phosphate oxidase
LSVDGPPDIATLRQTQCSRETLRKADLPPDPIEAFRAWMEEALRAGVVQANAMTLATVSPDGRPAARIVLLREFDARGFCFYTNYESRKGRDLAQNPWAALVFWWEALSRQVRVEGQVEVLTAVESDAYFASRPRGSRLGAWASSQSQPITGRAVLEDRLRELESTYVEEEPPRPTFWGGYRVRPVRMEFWQSGLHRLHDRFEYRRNDDASWILQRLAP